MALPPPPTKRPGPPTASRPGPPAPVARPKLPGPPKLPGAPQGNRPPAPRKIERLVYTSDVPITVQALIDRARKEALHPYATAYRMDEPLPWGFGLVIWIELRGLETKRRLGLPENRPLGEEYAAEVLKDMCAYLNTKVPKFAIK